MKRENSRRVIMTKRLIKDAYLDLLEQEDQRRITVTAICERADVHRSTFYRYYSEPANVLREIEQDFLDMIPDPAELSGLNDFRQVVAGTAEFFDLLRQNERTFRILFNGETGSIFTARLVQLVSEKYVPIPDSPENPSARFGRLYVAYGAVGIMKEWVYAGFPVSSQEIAEMLYSFSKEGIDF